MNGRVARRLRAIAKDIKLSPQTDYAWAGKLRRRPDYTDAEGVRQPGAPIPRPLALTYCFRRAYKEAKKIYKGLSPSICVPEDSEAETEMPFHARVVTSMKKYHAQQN